MTMAPRSSRVATFVVVAAGLRLAACASSDGASPSVSPLADAATGDPGDAPGGGGAEGGPAGSDASGGVLDGGDADGALPDGGRAGTKKRWHPGHYVASVTLSTQANAAAVHTDWKAALATDPHLAGARAIYTWHDLENAQGAYTPAAIDGDLAFLKSLDPRYKLIIEVWTRDFSGKKALPAVPQASASAGVPDYVLQSGGAVINSNGVCAAFWRPAVMARMIALQSYLAARYDGNVAVEGVHTDEFNVPNPTANDPTFSPANGWAQWQQLLKAMANAWVHTNAFYLGNWPGIGGSGQTGTATTLAFAQSLGLGVGGPDILPDATIWPGGAETWGEQGLQAKNGFGTTDFRGQVPISYQMENPYGAAGLVPSMCETYGYDSLKATHLTWVYATASTGLGLMPWSATLAALQAHAFRVHAACPANYQGACDPT
jgi:hypothetical protein